MNFTIFQKEPLKLVSKLYQENSRVSAYKFHNFRINTIVLKHWLHILLYFGPLFLPYSSSVVLMATRLVVSYSCLGITVLFKKVSRAKHQNVSHYSFNCFCPIRVSFLYCCFFITQTCLLFYINKSN